jgi:hypothetical protein
MLDASLPPGLPTNKLDGIRHFLELKTLSQRDMSIAHRARHIQRDLEEHAQELDT